MPDLTGRRTPVLAAAGILFAAVFALRLAIDDPAELVTVLYAFPIALVAVALGVWWGLGAAALSLALFRSGTSPGRTPASAPATT